MAVNVDIVDDNVDIVDVSLSSHSTSASVSERSRLVNTYSCILAKMQ